MRFNQKRTQLVKDQSQISSNRTTSIIRPMRKNENKKNVKWILLKKNQQEVSIMQANRPVKIFLNTMHKLKVKKFLHHNYHLNNLNIRLV